MVTEGRCGTRFVLIKSEGVRCVEGSADFVDASGWKGVSKGVGS